MRLIIKARKMAIGTIVYRRSGAMRKVAEGKWVPLPSKELKGHQDVFDKVSAALRSVNAYDYNLSTTKGHAQLARDKYTALKKKFPSLSISLKRFVQISNKQSNLTGWDVEEDIAENIIKKMSKARK